MAKYKVVCFIPVRLEIEVDAEDEDSAIDVALMEHAGLSSYAGNGGIDKLVIEAYEEPLNEGTWLPFAMLSDEDEDDEENE